MKKLISLLIIISLTVNIAFKLRVPSAQAGEWVIKEKSSLEAKKLGVFPGIIFPSTVFYYNSDYFLGTLIACNDIGAIYWFVNRDKIYDSNSADYIILNCAYYAWLVFSRTFSVLGSERITNNYNNRYSSKEYLLKASKSDRLASIIFLLLGGSMIGGAAIDNTGMNEKNFGYLLGTTTVIAGIIGIIQSKKIKTAIFKERTVPSSKTIVSPIIRPDMSGIMVIKQF